MGPVDAIAAAQCLDLKVCRTVWTFVKSQVIVGCLKLDCLGYMFFLDWSKVSSLVHVHVQHIKEHAQTKHTAPIKG